MSYAARKAELGRQVVQIVEIDLDFCTRTYGVSPCTAAIGTTGTIKCFNTRKTCQDSVNYASTAKTYRFSNIVLPPSGSLDFVAIPAIRSIALAPTVIDPGNGLGKRGVVTVVLRDFAYPDTDTDPYLSGRGYDSATRGTYFTKMLARNPYYQGRPMRVKIGYVANGVEPDTADFDTRYYFIESISGPDKNGIVTITAKDPLKMLDDDRSQAPVASTSTLASDIDDGSTSATIPLAPTGTGALFPSSGFVVIDSEVIQYGSKSGDALSALTRSRANTMAVEHKKDATVQLCLAYGDREETIPITVGITTVLYDLLVNYAGIPSSYIDLAAWNAESDTWLSDYLISTIVYKPTGVAALVAELAQQCLFYIWWDERAQLIKLKAIRPTTRDTVTAIDDTDNVIADSQGRKENADQRLTQVWIYYGQKDPTVDLAKPYNFQRLQVSVDADAETPQEYGDSRVYPIFSRWLTVGNKPEAQKLGDRLLARYRDIPKTITFRLDAKDSDIWTGDVVHASIRCITDVTGAITPTALQVLQVSESVPGSEYEYVLQDTFFNGRYAFITPDAQSDYSAATDAEKAKYGFIGPDSGQFADTTMDYKIV